MLKVSVKIDSKLERFVNDMLKDGRAASKADVARKALRFLAQEEAVKAVLKAQNEPVLKGDIRDILNKI